MIRALSAFVLSRRREVSIALIVAISVGMSVLALFLAAALSAHPAWEVIDQGLVIAIVIPLLVSAPVGTVIVELVHALQREHRRALDAAQRDALTGLPTRRHTLEVAHRNLGHSRRTGFPFSIALIDLDDFKSANDRHGHATGDALLRVVADACRTTLRDTDVAGRWGGEEFLVLLPGTDSLAATAMMERVRAAIAASRVPVQGNRRFGCTASIGVATLGGVTGCPQTDEVGVCAEALLDTLVATADRRMYAAKSSGKNRVASDEPVPTALLDTATAASA